MIVSTQISHFLVIAAKDLVSADKNGLSDPYVKAKIIPEAEDGEAKYKTKTCRKNLNPEFNETFVIDIKPADRSKRLLVEVTYPILSISTLIHFVTKH